LDLIAPEYYLEKILKGRVPDDTLAYCGPFLYELRSKLGMSYSDICFLCFSCPALLTSNQYSVLENVSELSKVFSLRDSDFKYLIFKTPYLLLIHHENIKYKFKLLSTTFGCSNKDIVRLLHQFPEMLYLSKSHITEQIKMLSEKLDECGMGLRTLFRNEPRLILSTEESLERIKKILMDYFTLSEREVQKVIKTVPCVALMTEDEIKEKFDFYYQTYFIKRDLKEIISACPEFLLVEGYVFKNKIKSLETVFGVDQKKACEFVRIEPKILFYNDVVEKIRGFLRYNINLEYIRAYPKLCGVPEISIPFKFVVARLLGLESRFYEICEMDSNIFLSRFLFMQGCGYFEHNDLLLDENAFYDKYKVTTKTLLLSYVVDLQVLENLSVYYLNKMQGMFVSGDVIFPPLDKIIYYLRNIMYKERKIQPKYTKVYNKRHISKRAFDLMQELKVLHLDDCEVEMIVNKNQMLNKYLGINCVKVVKLLLKYGFSIEKIVYLLYNKLSLFTYSVQDFEMVLQEICEVKQCSVEEAVIKHM